MSKKKKKFGVCVDSSLYVISNQVNSMRGTDIDTKIKKSGRTLVIKSVDEYNDHDKVISIIRDVVTQTFGIKKPSKICKVNSFDGKIWVRFKKAS